MRVALVVPDLKPSSGGPAENVPRLAQALAAQGVEVELHTAGDVPFSTTNPMGVAARPGRPTRLGRSPQLRRNLLASRADVFHANCLWMLPLGYAARAARLRRAPLVISPRGMLAPWSLARARWKKALARRVLHPGAMEGASGWHATSAQEAADIQRLGFAQPICVAPNGIDTPQEVPSAVRAHYESVAPELRGRRILLFYSRFHEKKRVLQLLDDFGAIAPSRPEWHLLVVGIPEQYSVERIVERAVCAGLSSRCTVLDGRGRPKPYVMADLFALPTHDENFGRVVAEALAAGVPVITSTGTPWQALNEVGAGRWVAPDVFRAELHGLLQLSANDLRAAGERGRLWVLATHDWSEIARVLVTFYDRLLQFSPGPPPATQAPVVDRSAPEK